MRNIRIAAETSNVRHTARHSNFALYRHRGQLAIVGSPPARNDAAAALDLPRDRSLQTSRPARLPSAGKVSTECVPLRSDPGWHPGTGSRSLDRVSKHATKSVRRQMVPDTFGRFLSDTFSLTIPANLLIRQPATSDLCRLFAVSSSFLS